MNRPFYAFGVLLAFLALAMLAIGLSSRPKHHPPSAGGGGSGTGSPRHAPGPSLYVLVLPDESASATDEYAIHADLCGQQNDRPTYERGCGLDRATGEVYSLCAAASRPSATTECCPPRVAMQSAAIELAVNPTAAGSSGRFDTLSYYDAVYDAAMSGTSPTFLASDSQAAVVEDFAVQLDADQQMLALFHSFNRAAASDTQGRRWDFEAHSMMRGVLNRVWRAVRSAGLDDDWMQAESEGTPATRRHLRTMTAPTWSDYEAWIGLQHPTVAHNTKFGGGTAFWSPPKDQVLQIAVSALNRVAELLHQAVLQMVGQATERVAGLGGVSRGQSLAK